MIREWILQFFFSYLTVVQVQMSLFYLHHSIPPQPSPLPNVDPTPLWFCPCVLCIRSWKSFPLFLPLPPPTSSLVTVSLFLISMSLVIFCFLVCFVDYSPLIGETIWYLSFTTWLISLSTCSPVPSILSQRVGALSFFLLHSIPLCKCTTIFWSTHLLMDT